MHHPLQHNPVQHTQVPHGSVLVQQGANQVLSALVVDRLPAGEQVGDYKLYTETIRPFSSRSSTAPHLHIARHSFLERMDAVFLSHSLKVSLRQAAAGLLKSMVKGNAVKADVDGGHDHHEDEEDGIEEENSEDGRGAGKKHSAGKKKSQGNNKAAGNATTTRPFAFPFGLKVDSNVLTDDGGAASLAVAGGWLALHSAGVPVGSPVAALSIGLLASEVCGVVCMPHV